MLANGVGVCEGLFGQIWGEKVAFLGSIFSEKASPISATLRSSFSDITTCLSATLDLSTGEMVLIARLLCTKEAAVDGLISACFLHNSLHRNALSSFCSLWPSAPFLPKIRPQRF